MVEDVEAATSIFAGTPSLKILREAGVRAVQSTPMISRSGALLGILTTHWRSPYLPDQHDLCRIDLLARQAADTIETARAEQAQKAANAEAERANRAKDEFLAVLSHELRGPLTSMLGWVKILQSQRLDDAATRKGLAVIERNVNAQAQLIEDLLDVSRVIAGKLTISKTPLDFSQVAEAVIDSFKVAASDRGVKLSWRLQPGLVLEGDETRLHQLLTNLIGNAIKFTPPGGWIEVSLNRESDGAVLRVADNGKGISADFLPHLFKRFSQEDSTKTRRYSGLGLGLAISDHIVQLHGGKISAASDGEGKGSTFTVHLPLPDYLRTIAIHRPPAGEIAAAPLRHARILVVEDSDDLRDFIRTALELYGAEVRSAPNANVGLAAVQEFRPTVLICDIGLPTEDGNFLIRRVREMERAADEGKMVAVALTGYAQAEDVEQCLAAGFDKHIKKPVEPTVLVRAILELLEAPARVAV